MTNQFLHEIFEQPAALRRCVERYPAADAALAEVVRAMQTRQFDRVVFTGMGSSLHACYPLLLALSQKTAVPAMMWDASELVHQAPDIITRRTLLIGVSQSGESAEIKQLVFWGRCDALAFIGRGPGSVLNLRMAKEIGNHGGRCMLITPFPTSESLSGIYELPIPQAASDALPILEIIPVQLLTIPLALARGFEPATFEHASKVTAVE